MSRMERIKDDLNLNTIPEVYFWKSEWEEFDPEDKQCSPSIGYLIFRGFIMCFFIGATATNMTCSSGLSYYFIFLTNMTFTLQLIYSMLYFIRLLWVKISRNDVEVRLFESNSSIPGTTQQPDPILPWPEKIIYVLANIVLVAPYAVSFGYWIFLFKSSNLEKSTVCENTADFLVHLFNSLIALLDMWVVAFPIRITSMIYTLIFGAFYCLFSGLYEVAGGTYSNMGDYIYPFLNWKKEPGMASLTSFLAIIFSAIGHALLCWGMYRLRVIVVNKYFSTKKVATYNVT